MYDIIMRTGIVMEKVEDIANIFVYNLITLKGKDCYEGNIRLNKYLHIMQIVYYAMI